jgi:hypothetical protein
MTTSNPEPPWHWYVAVRPDAAAATVRVQRVADAHAARALTKGSPAGTSCIAIEATNEASARQHAREYWQLPGWLPPRGRQRRRP